MKGLDPDQEPKPEKREKRQRGSRGGSRGQSGFKPKTKRPQASERASILAQDWYDQGAALGFDFPYDVNYFALALQRRIEHDAEMRVYLKHNRHDQVERWVSKMIERWYAEYVSNEIHAGNAKDFFLATDWDDLRDYSKTCLEAAWAKKHGKRKAVHRFTDDDNETGVRNREYREELDDLRKRHAVEAYLAQVAEAEAPDVQLDEEGRERLRSWRDKRRSK